MDNSILVFGGSGDLGRALIEDIKFWYSGKIWASFHTREFSEEGVNTFYYDAEEGLRKRELSLLKEEKIDVLIYLIGTHSSKKKVKDTEIDEWRNLLEVNAFGFLKIYHQLYFTLTKSKTKIIAISSSAAYENKRLNGPYSASKSFLESICMTIDKEDDELDVFILEPSLFDSKLAREIVRLKGYEDFEKYVKAQLGGNILSINDIIGTIKEIMLSKLDRLENGNVIRIVGQKENM